MKSKKRQVTKRKLLIFIALFGILGIATQLFTSAASNSATLEPESGTLSRQEIAITDQTASNGQAIRFSEVSATTGQFIRTVDVGPQASTFGHTPAGTLKQWTGSNEIKEGTLPRDTDGWMRIKGYEFTGRLKISTGNVELSDCKVNPGVQTAHHDGMIYSSSSAPSGSMIIDHCYIDQGTSGYSVGAINVYQPVKMTVRYTHIVGSGDGIKANSDGLYHDNYINVKAGTNSLGHMDGIQGSYYKVNWTARHNTIISGVEPSASALAAGASTRPEAGGNIGIWGSVDSAPYNYGVVAENNYIDGFSTGISLQGTDPNNPNIVRNNTFGKNFRYYPVYRIRTWTEWPHTLVEENNVFDRNFDENTGNTTAY